MNYAFNIADLHKFFSDPEYNIMVQCMIYPVLKLKPTSDLVDCEKGRLDGMAVRVKEDTPEDQMQAMIDIIRNGLGQRSGVHKNALRIYQSKTGKGGWKRI